MKTGEWIGVFGIIATIIGYIVIFANTKYQFKLQRHLLLEQAKAASTVETIEIKKKPVRTQGFLRSEWLSYLLIVSNVAMVAFLLWLPGPVSKWLVFTVALNMAAIMFQVIMMIVGKSLFFMWKSQGEMFDIIREMLSIMREADTDHRKSLKDTLGITERLAETTQGLNDIVGRTVDTVRESIPMIIVAAKENAATPK